MYVGELLQSVAVIDWASEWIQEHGAPSASREDVLRWVSEVMGRSNNRQSSPETVSAPELSSRGLLVFLFVTALPASTNRPQGGSGFSFVFVG